MHTLLTKNHDNQENTWSKVCCAKSVVDIITPAANEPNSRLRPNLSLHWRWKSVLRILWKTTNRYASNMETYMCILQWTYIILLRIQKKNNYKLVLVQIYMLTHWCYLKRYQCQQYSHWWCHRTCNDNPNAAVFLSRKNNLN